MGLVRKQAKEINLDTFDDENDNIDEEQEKI